MSTASTFTKTAARAFELPTPRAIAMVILSSTDKAHNGLRAATYEARVRGGDSLPHPERVAEQRNPELRHDGDTKPPPPRKRRSTPLDDLRELSQASSRFVDSIDALNAECMDAGTPETWEEAVKDAHLMAELDVIQSALDLGRNVTKWVHTAEEAVITVHRIHDGNGLAHIPDGFAKLATGEPVCLSHARIGDYDRGRHGQLHVCRSCYDLMSYICHPAEHHHDPDYWPAVEVLREKNIYEETGKRRDFIAARNLWVERKEGRRSA